MTLLPGTTFLHINEALEEKEGLPVDLVNQSLVWFDGRVVYALHNVDFVYRSPFPGGFTYFQGCSGSKTYCHAKLSSPLISSGAGWKCLQFWYHAWGGQLKVLLVSNETTSRTFGPHSSFFWRRGRVNLSSYFPYEVSIITKSLSSLLL